MKSIIIASRPSVISSLRMGGTNSSCTLQLFRVENSPTGNGTRDVVIASFRVDGCQAASLDETLRYMVDADRRAMSSKVSYPKGKSNGKEGEMGLQVKLGNEQTYLSAAVIFAAQVKMPLDFLPSDVLEGDIRLILESHGFALAEPIVADEVKPETVVQDNTATETAVVAEEVKPEEKAEPVPSGRNRRRQPATV